MTVQLTPLSSARFAEWREAARTRLIGLRQDSGMLVGDDAVAHAESFLAEILADGDASAASRILVIGDGGAELGTVWLAIGAGKLFVVDLALSVEPSARQRDELFALVRSIADEQALSRISVGLYRHDVEGHALIAGRGFELASIQMILEPLPTRDAASGLVLAPMSSERFVSFAAASEAGFAADLVASGRYTAVDAAAESHRQMSLELPDGVASAGQELFTAHADGAEVGILWLGMRTRGGRPHAFILDIEVAVDHRRRGYGREIMQAAEHEARRLGAASIGLHVFGFNTAAVRLYEQLGYRRTEESYFLDL